MNTGAADKGKGYGKVVVLMGGCSAEREISLLSGQAVLQGLLAQGIDAHGQDSAADDFQDILARENYARAFIALHGRGGEDGVVQGMLENLDIPYTGSDATGSALAIDKLRTKQIWQSAGIPTPSFVVLKNAQDVAAAKDTFEYPVIVKPVREGSSIGISKVDTAAELADAWQLAARYDDSVIAEQWVHGAEYTAGILGDEVLPLIRLETPNVFYDYAAKYESDTTRYLLPCGLDAAQETGLQAASMDAFRAVGAGGWGRVDFMLDESGKPWFIEVNTVPGLTDHSLVPMAAKATGTDFNRLVCRILDTSFDDTTEAVNAGA